MNHPYTPTVRRMHRKGFSVRDIMAVTGLARSDVQRALGRKQGRPRNVVREQLAWAAAELRAEGFDADKVAQVFGE